MSHKIAMTGATGFVGAETLMRALAAGCQVNALTRRAQPPQANLKWVHGALDDHRALDTLVRDVEAVIHIAGVVNVANRTAFEEGNVAGTISVIDAMRRQGVKRLIHVSSLAAREPDLSDYGWSKELSERHVKASGLDWTIVRPPAIYGPNDKEMLELFRMAKKGILMLPPTGRLSVIEVSDLAKLLLALSADQDISKAKIYEVDDGNVGGWDHAEFGNAIAAALGKSVRTMATPAWLMKSVAYLDRAVRGQKAKLTPDRANYFCHPDWVASPDQQVEQSIWIPEVDTIDGLRRTADAYRDKGWL